MAPSRRDIYHIALLLRQKLVSDLVRPIIEYASLYDEITVSKDLYLVVRITNSPQIYSHSMPIMSKTQTRTPVHKVSFTITAKDQGYFAYPGHGSWTGFTAGIVRANFAEIHEEREVLRNNTSFDGFTAQSVTWSTSSSNEQEAKWVRSLKCGDVIVVRAYAAHMGWVNFIKAVEITISQAVIVR